MVNLTSELKANAAIAIGLQGFTWALTGTTTTGDACPDTRKGTGANATPDARSAPGPREHREPSDRGLAHVDPGSFDRRMVLELGRGEHGRRKAAMGRLALASLPTGGPGSNRGVRGEACLLFGHLRALSPRRRAQLRAPVHHVDACVDESWQQHERSGRV